MIKFGLIAAMVLAAAPAHAQGDAVGPRVAKLEREMRAVQRKVFPGGGGQFFEAEIAPATPVTEAAGVPASTPLADLTERVSALEAQLQSLTGQIEQSGFKVRQIEEAFGKYRADIDARLKAIEGGATPDSVSASGATGPVPAASVRPPPVSARLTPARQVALEAIEMPATGDAGEDSYLYGYRLWDAKFYPQAQAQLKATVDKHPRHKSLSRARNLLGRAYLDDGKPALAATAFYENYEKAPRGERAPDSLYYFGVSLNRLNKPADACKAFEEFAEVYGASASASLSTQVAKARGEAKCG